MSFLPLTHSVIYVLVDPRDGLIRYVGTSQNPNTRLKEHVREIDGESKVKVWVKELVSAGLRPLMVIVDTVVSDEAEKTEMEWIDHFDKFGHLHNNRKK